jgi:predicted amidohydrolase
MSSVPSGLLSKTIRIAIVQYQQRTISSWKEFEEIVTYFVDVVADYKSDFVLFPELFTLQLLSITNETVPPEEAIDTLTEYTKPLQNLFHNLAIKYNVNIIGGSHPTKMRDGSIQNICFVCLRDGSVHPQPKIHPTPSERYWWNIKGGHKLSVIDTDCGPVGVLICYDVEFPELARHLIDQGANILFVPFCTDERQAYLRVRYSAQARAVENQCYVVMAGNVGNLPRVRNMDIQYAQSCILTPCDFYFARDGIAADTTPNVEQVAFADLRLDNLFEARHSGTVLNVRDRRHDLYSVVWHKRKKEQVDHPSKE